MTIYSLALRVKEITDLQMEYDLTRDKEVLTQINDRQLDLEILVESIINTYHVPTDGLFDNLCVDVDQYGS